MSLRDGALRFEAAEPLLLEGYDSLKRQERPVPASGRSTLRQAMERLVQLHGAWAKPAPAAEWKQKLAAFDKIEAAKEFESRRAQ